MPIRYKTQEKVFLIRKRIAYEDTGEDREGFFERVAPLAEGWRIVRCGYNRNSKHPTRKSLLVVEREVTLDE